MKKSNQEKVDEIFDVLAGLSLPAKLEILGNTFIQLGFSTLDEDIPMPPGHLTLMDILAEHRATNGETLGTALAQQGLVLLMWIDNLTKDEEK